LNDEERGKLLEHEEFLKYGFWMYYSENPLTFEHFTQLVEEHTTNDSDFYGIPINRDILN